MMILGIILTTLIVLYIIGSSSSVPTKTQNQEHISNTPKYSNQPNTPSKLSTNIPKSYTYQTIKPTYQPQASSNDSIVKFMSDDSFSVPSLNNDNFFMRARFSENKNWLIGTTISGIVNSKREKGSFIVISQNKVSVYKKLDNPYKGFIANNGSFIIIDNLDPAQRTQKGIFYIFSCDGEIIIKKIFRESNILCADITPNGNFAFCQTYDNDLYFYNLEKKRQCRHVESAIRLYHHNQNFRFDMENNRIIANFDGREYRYHFQGGMYKDGDSYLDDALQMQKSTNPDFNQILSLLLSAKFNDTSSNKDAKLYKALGETYYHIGDMKKAALYLNFALEENPKCGVKQLLNKIVAEKPAK